MRQLFLCYARFALSPIDGLVWQAKRKMYVWIVVWKEVWTFVFCSRRARQILEYMIQLRGFFERWNVGLYKGKTVL